MSIQITQSVVLDLQALYDRDFQLWLDATAQLLQEGRLLELDSENLLEEIEEISKSQKRALRSNLRVVLLHLLKYQFQSEKRSTSWRSTIREHRYRLAEALAESPSLQPYLIEVFNECYDKARLLASDETEMSVETFPINPSFTPEEVLNFDFLPNEVMEKFDE